MQRGRPQEHSRRSKATSRSVLTCVLAALALSACEDFEPPAGATTPRGSLDASAPSGGAGGDLGSEPPAAAVDASVQAPEQPALLARASRGHVLVPNPREHAVAVVDPHSLEATQLPCAQAPSLVAASEGSDRALALDAEARTACALDLASEPASSRELRVLPHANAIALSPDARYALVYHDRAAAERAGEEPQSSVEVSVVRLTEPASAATVLVGLHPRGVDFASDGETAFVSSDAGVSVLPLEAAAAGELGQAPPRGLLDGPFLSDATLRVAADGARAVAFEPDGAVLHVIELASGLSRAIDLAAWAELAAQDGDAGVELVTARIADAVIERDGARAFVALRGEQTVLELSLAEAIGDAPTIAARALPGQPSDRLALAGGEAGRLLVLASGDGRATLLRIDGEAGSLRVPLVSAPGRVLADDEGLGFVLSHGDGASPAAGYSVLRASDGLSRFSASAQPPHALALSTEAPAVAAVVQPSGEDDAVLELIDLRTLERATRAFAGTPLATGFVDDGRYAFAQVAHPDGRLTFIELAAGERRTATGFLIAQRVRQ